MELGELLTRLGGTFQAMGGDNSTLDSIQKSDREAQEKLIQAQKLQLERLDAQEKLLRDAANKLDPNSKEFQEITNALDTIHERKVRDHGLSPVKVPLVGKEVEPTKSGRIIRGDSKLGKEMGLGANQVAEVYDLGRDKDGNITFSDYQDITLGRNKTTINNNLVNAGDDKFQEERGKERSARINSIVESGQTATATDREFTQLSEIVVSPDFRSGKLQPALTTIQALASDLGVNLEETLSEMGIAEIGDLQTKESFDRITKTVIIDGFEKFKGNLNQKEVELAIDAFAGLGKGEESNIDAIAAGLAASKLAMRRGQQAALIDTNEGAKKFISDYMKGDTKEFMELKNKIKEEMLSKRTAAQGDIPEAAINAGINQEIWDVMPEEDRALFND